MLNFSLGVLAALQLLTNFILQVAVISTLGVGRETDAYIAAQTLPLLFFSILSVSMQSVWQPRLAVLSDNVGSWRKEQGFAQGQALVLFGTSVLLLCFSARLWAPLLFPGFTTEQVALTVSLTQVTLVATVLNGHAALLSTAQRARNRFIAVEVVSLTISVVAIGAVMTCAKRYGVESVVWINLARAALICGSFWMLAERPIPLLWGKSLNKDTWRNMTPLLAGSLLYKTGPVVDKFWSSQAPTGSVTIFNLVQTGMGALAIVFDKAFSVSATPRLARLANAKDFRGFRALYRGCLKRISMAVAAIAVLLALVEPVWSLMVEKVLKVQEPFAGQMWLISILLLGYLHVAASGVVMAAAFYAMGDVKTPVKIGVIGFIIGVFFKSALFIAFGISGLAIATSFYYIGNLVAMCWLLEKRINARLS